MIYELMVIILSILAGASLASVLGIRSILALIPLGVLFAVALRVFSFSFLNLIDQLQLNVVFWFLIASLMIVLAIIRGRFFTQLKLLAAITPIALVAVFITRIEKFGSPVYGDPSWILSMSEMMQSGVDMETLNGRVSIKRGFAFPLMLALGGQGEYLSALPAVLFMALIIAIFWGAKRLSPESNKTLVFLALGVLLSAPIVIRSALYLNGHILMALAVTVAVVLVVVSVRDKNLETTELIVLMVSLSVISTTRAEGIAVAALIVLPLIASRWISRKQIMLIISSATLSFGIWLSVYNSYILNSTGLWWPVFVLILFGLGLLVAAKPFDFVRFRVLPLAVIAEALLITVAGVIFFDELENGIASQFENIVLNAGLWGVTLIAAFLGIIYLAVLSEHKTFALLTVALVLGQVILKMVDGGQFGEPTLGRVGWADSLNRMWLHLSGVFALVFVLVIANPKQTNQKLFFRWLSKKDMNETNHPNSLPQ